MGTPIEITLLASAAQTLTQTLAEYDNYSGFRGIEVIVDVTTAGTGSITPKLQYGYTKFDGTIAWLDLVVAQAARTTNGQTRLKLYPTVLAAASSPDQSVNAPLPFRWRVVVTANNANAMTYNVQALLLP